MDVEHICYTCEYHDDYSMVCFNGDSPQCADFTGYDDTCEHWEEKREVKNGTSDSISN